MCDEPGDVLGSGVISIVSLATSSSVTITCPLTSLQQKGGRGGACVEVLVTVEEEEVIQQVSHGPLQIAVIIICVTPNILY